MIKVLESPDLEKFAEICLETERFFGSETPLRHSSAHGGPGYEPRAQQVEMANLVAQALADSRNLVIEAPTGVGKSFAYLVPAVLYALKSEYPVLISTETISLQEQLVRRDIPLLEKLLDKEFRAVLAKGRGNYLCRRRLRLAAGEHQAEYLPSEAMVPKIQQIAYWANETMGGSLSELPFQVDRRLWDCVCCEVGNCTSQRCPFFRRCFYWNERHSWDHADIIVANHALLFTDLKQKEMEKQGLSLLPTYGAVIFDEAHTLEDSAANHLGLRVNSVGLQVFLRRLFDPERGKGLILASGETGMGLRNAVAETIQSVDTFFNSVREFIATRNEGVTRLRQPGFVRDTVSEPLAHLASSLQERIKEMTEEEDADARQELQARLQRCLGYQQEIHDFLYQSREDHVYWLENGFEGKSQTLYAAPLNVAELLRKLFFNGDFPVVLTSATLSVCGGMAYYLNRVGFCDGDEHILDSPFDHARQVKIHIPLSIPLPTDDEYLPKACFWIRHYLHKTGGKAFVLFTSYQMMYRAAENLQSYFDQEGIRLFVQGGELNRTAMLDAFRKDIDSVIFGTSSFWMGVDVPGEALSNVIITRLPFAVPSHPLVQARVERIEADGKSSFRDYQLPEAILRFKQGVGRLIRSRSDRGIIAILDRRIKSKSYGSSFLNSIPPGEVQYD